MEINNTNIEKPVIGIRELDNLLEKFKVRDLEDLENRLNYFETGKHDIASYERTIKNYKEALKRNTKAICELIRKKAWTTQDDPETGEPWCFEITEGALEDIEKIFTKGL